MFIKKYTGLFSSLELSGLTNTICSIKIKILGKTGRHSSCQIWREILSQPDP